MNSLFVKYIHVRLYARMYNIFTFGIHILSSSVH